MNTLQIVLLSSLLLFVPLSPCVLAAPPAIPRQMELIEATIEGGSIYSVDPAAIYDTASAAITLNVYDTLVMFDGEHLDRYLPSLAIEWSIVGNDPPIVSSHTGLKFYYTYYFKIRTGVPWHNSSCGTVTPEDVEYTFERGMVLEPGDNPQWMFYEPLLNGATAEYINGTSYDLSVLADQQYVGWAIDEAVESNGTHVWFNLAFPGAYAPFMQILTKSWSAIICKNWTNSLGRPSNWNGTWGDDHSAWAAYHYPAVPPLDDPALAVMGSGPFILAHLDQTLQYWDANRFTNYWRGWALDWPGFGSSKPAGYIDHFVVTWAYDWNTRSTMFLNGEVDICAVPRYYIGQIQGQPGIRCVYPLPSLSVGAFVYQFSIDPTSPHNLILPSGTFNEFGVPSDFFGNSSWGVHVRKAFSYAIDYEAYFETLWPSDPPVYSHPATVIVPALPYYSPSVSGYYFDLNKTVEELRQVPGLWDTGFTLTFLYNVGGLPRHEPYTQLAEAINTLNPKFHCSAVGLDWQSYLKASEEGWLPARILGWLADYPDPHNFAYPYYYSLGNYAFRQGYSNPVMDALIDQGISQLGHQEREATYASIQQLAIEDCPSTALYTALGQHFERTWVCGWYHNPAYPGIYAANLWKWYYTPHAQLDTVTNDTSNLLSYDVSYDGKVNMYDVGATAASFGAIYGPPISNRWNFRCDFNNDRKIDMKDIGAVAKNFGRTSSVWSPSS